MTATVTTQPAYGTIDYYAAMIRENADRHDGILQDALLMAAALGPIQSIARPERDLTDAERVALIRNVLAAERLVRAELAAA